MTGTKRIGPADNPKRSVLCKVCPKCGYAESMEKPKPKKDETVEKHNRKIKKCKGGCK